MTQAIATLVVAMLSIQVGASFGKQLFPLVGPAGATALRLFFASAILLAIFRPWRGTYTKKQLIWIGAYGSCLGIMNLLFYLSLDRIPLGVAVALEFSGPLALALAFSRRLLDVLWVVIAILGIFLVVPASSEASFELVGCLYALGAGACWAGYIYFGKKAGSSHGSKVVALGMLIATLVVAPFAASISNLNFQSSEIWLLGLLVALLSSAIPYSLEMMSLKSMPTTVFGVLMSLEPAVAGLVGVVFLHEYLTSTQCVAVGLIIVASAGSAYMNRSSARPEL